MKLSLRLMLAVSVCTCGREKYLLTYVTGDIPINRADSLIGESVLRLRTITFSLRSNIVDLNSVNHEISVTLISYRCICSLKKILMFKRCNKTRVLIADARYVLSLHISSFIVLIKENSKSSESK